MRSDSWLKKGQIDFDNWLFLHKTWSHKGKNQNLRHGHSGTESLVAACPLSSVCSASSGALPRMFLWYYHGYVFPPAFLRFCLLS